MSATDQNRPTGKLECSRCGEKKPIKVTENEDGVWGRCADCGLLILYYSQVILGDKPEPKKEVTDGRKSDEEVAESRARVSLAYWFMDFSE